MRQLDWILCAALVACNTADPKGATDSSGDPDADTGDVIDTGAPEPTAQVYIGGAHTRERFGANIDGDIDFNGDGLSDVFVASRGYSETSGAAESAVHLFFGSTDPQAEMLSSDADLTLPGSETDHIGLWGGTLKDTNGDGYDEIFVYNSMTSGGALLVLDGGVDTLALEDARGWITRSTDSDLFGWYPSAEDVDQDGISDLLVSSDDSSVYLFQGPIIGEQLPEDALAHISPPEGTSSRALGRVSAMADLDGDGARELLLSAQNIMDSDNTRLSGVFAFSGSMTGEADLDNAEVSLLERLDHSGGTFAGHFDTLGDVNGDGYDDIAISDARYATVPDSGATAAGYVFFGPLSGERAPEDADIFIVGDSIPNAYAGAWALPDLDGDGRKELASLGYNNPYLESSQGSRFDNAIYIYPSALLSEPGTLDCAAGTLVQDPQFPGEDISFGTQLTPGGDINGDGRPDLLTSSLGAHDEAGRVDILLDLTP